MPAQQAWQRRTFWESTASRFLISVLGTAVLFGIYKRRSNRLANGPLVISLTMAAGLVLALLARHPASYNLQILMIPIAVGFVSFVLHLEVRDKNIHSLIQSPVLPLPRAQALAGK